MKKHLLLSAFIILGLTSCTNESTLANTAESMKTPAMQAYDKAFRSLGDPRNRPNEEERKSNTRELSDRRKALLLPACKDLVLSTGVSEAQMMSETHGDTSAIIIWATKIYQQKNNEIAGKLKSQN
jgi:flagellar motor protein MotB